MDEMTIRRLGEHVVRVCDRPLRVGLLTSLAALIFVVLRVLVAGNGHVGSLILLGSRYVSASGLPTRLPILHGTGYDGQFYYRLALDPLDTARQAFGITFDSPERLQRVAYPMLAWLLAAGHPGAVPWTLIIVNLIALGCLGAIGAQFALEGGRNALWGLLLCGYFGFLWSLGRDLTEIVASSFLAGGLLALRHRRTVVAGLLLAGATLSRETALLTVAAVGAAWLLGLAPPARKRLGQLSLPPASAVFTWAVPLAVFAAWQLRVKADTGHLPITSASSANLGTPFVGLARGFSHYLHEAGHIASFIWFWELAVLAVVLVTTLTTIRHSRAALHEWLAFFAVLALVISLAPGIWLGDVGFRSLDDLWVLSVIILLSSDLRLRVCEALVALTWAGAAFQLILFI